ncbi:MAG: segregation/condensation protein A [Planctomycetota bacterium]|nr:segregation/condensation protein A [Planctomycetota bacterium]
MQGSIEDYRVELDCYAGPLDLLLFLVRRHEIDLNDIPIARLTEQYLEHLKLIQQIDVDLAGEFLVMAATLLEIKSAMLLPRPEVSEADAAAAAENAAALDPRSELVQQLLAYKRFKDAANELDARRSEWQSRFARKPGRDPALAGTPLPGAEIDIDDPHAITDDDTVIEIDLEDTHVLDLCAAFARILESIGQTSAHQVVYDDTPIQLHADDILDRLQRDGSVGKMTLQQIFVGRTNRSEMIGLFLATLELVRQKRVRVLQERDKGEIVLELRPQDEQISAADDKAADWRDPKTGEVQYDWPTDDARKRAERRARLRAAWAAKGGKADEEPPMDVTEEAADAEEAEAVDEPAEDEAV